MFHMSTEKNLDETARTEPHHRHTLYAHNMGSQFDPDRHHGNALGWMEWAGQHEPNAQYPGEIQMVERGYGMDRPAKGLMTDLYRIGHEVNMGQSTVPLHSPNRTPEGEAWSAKVGGPRPRLNDFRWQPPAGIHPYEQKLQKAQFHEQPGTQPTLPGMGQMRSF